MSLGARKQGDRVLVSTLPPMAGGVRTMTDFVLGLLSAAGFQPVVGYYLPYSVDPGLSVPVLALGRRTVSERVVRDDSGVERHEIGAWFPELEFMHYQATHIWADLVASCRFHLAVSGNGLAALPYVRLGKPFLNWVATPWREDRRQREAYFNPLRRLFDAALVRPVATRIEREILGAGTLVALSEYTRRELDAIAGRPVVSEVMPSPIEQRSFRPDPSRVVPGRLGFTGRLSDPRKNVKLLIEALAVCRKRGLPATAVLVGGELLPDARQALKQHGLEACVQVHPRLPREDLPALLQTFDAYVLPSAQEGLCIAALEAMACGCPVVSTRCGGPEEFVLEGETGYLTGFDAIELGDAIEKTICDRARRDTLSRAAQSLVTARYGEDAAVSTFWRAFEKAFPGP